MSRVTWARLSPVIFCKYCRSSPFVARLCVQYSCSHSVRLTQPYTSARFAASNSTSSVASKNPRICSRLNFSPFRTLMFNPQHAELRRCEKSTHLRWPSCGDTKPWNERSECVVARFSGPPCLRNHCFPRFLVLHSFSPRLQAHSALETNFPSRLILHWTRLLRD